MKFMNLKEAKKVYTEEPMKLNIKKLMDYDIFHCLLASQESTIEMAKKVLIYMPKQYEEWLKYCDGGLLFDIELLTSQNYSDEEIVCGNLKENNTKEVYEMSGLPKGYLVFALESTGDLYCFNAEEKDEQVYLWNIEQGDFTDIWVTFEDWLIEQIDTAEEFIADGTLEPLDIKL